MFFQASSMLLSALILSSEAASIRGLGSEFLSRQPAIRGRDLGFENALVAREPQNNNRQNGGNNNFGGFNNNNNNNNNAAKSSSSVKATATTAATNNNNNNNAGGGGSACLNANAVQTGSASDGNQTPADGQAASAT